MTCGNADPIAGRCLLGVDAMGPACVLEQAQVKRLMSFIERHVLVSAARGEYGDRGAVDEGGA